MLLRRLEREHDGDRASCEEYSDGVIEIEVEGASNPYTFAWTGPNEFTSEQQNLDSLSPGTTSWSMLTAVRTREPLYRRWSPAFHRQRRDHLPDEPLLIYGPLGYDYEWQDGSNNQFFYVSPGDFAPGRTALSSAERPTPVVNSPIP